MIARFDHLYLVSLYEGATGLLREREQDSAGRPPRGLVTYNGEDPAAGPVSHPSYDRGLFTVPVAGGMLRFAFLPAYLKRLSLSREELEASPDGT